MQDLKVYRKKKNLSQTDVAVAVGVSLVAYQQWERGASTPKPENLVKLKKILALE